MKCQNPKCRKEFEPKPHVRARQKVCGRADCATWRKSRYGAEVDAALSRAKYMDRDELARFLEAADAYSAHINGRWYWAFKLMVNACLRVGELGAITPAAFIQNGEERQVVVPTLKRAGNPALPVDIDKKTFDGVLKYAKAQAIGQDSPIWPYSTVTVHVHFREVVAIARLGGYTTHSLRHSGIVLRSSIARTVEDFDWLRRSARHSSGKTTQVYLHTTSKRRKELVDRMKWV